ncbi:MAG TPA: hypothetical protein VLW75_07480 [Rhizomicrobium sp.]|nr:hypothetical protein [Rhizomicrobium sp.]
MKYDLDRSPVVIRSSRVKMLLAFIACSVFAAIGADMTSNESMSRAGYVIAGIFGLGMLFAVFAFVRPAWLELSPKGLRFFTRRKIECYSWDDFHVFRIYAPGTFSRHVGYILAPQSLRNTKATAIVRRMFGIDGGFGGGWTIGARDLANLLIRAKEKWGAA